MSERALRMADRSPLPTALFAAVCAALLLVYVDTLGSAVSTWLVSEAYLHCFLVPPICAVLVWQNRRALLAITPSPFLPGVALLAALSALWWLADIMGVQALKQFSVVAMVAASVLALLGPGVFSVLRFPLLYLFFAVPFGDALIPYLIEITATFVVDALNVLGIPVYRDGRYFHIPTGSYEVARACSGLKYFISTFALATLYSYFLFVGAGKRVLFVGVALLLSIIGNGVRATAIVLLLHYTDLNIAAGPDHEFVGWIVYFLLIVLLGWLGNRFQDRDLDPGDKASGVSPGPMQAAAAPVRYVGVAALAVAGFLLGPVLGRAGVASPDGTTILTAGLPRSTADWVPRTSPGADWRPAYYGYAQLSLAEYTKGDDAVGIAIVRYLTQHQGAEISNSENSIVPEPTWQIGDVQSATVDVANVGLLEVREVIAWTRYERRLVWYWMDVNGIPIANEFRTKVTELRNALSGRPSVSSALIVSTAIVESKAESQQLLGEFMNSMGSSLQGCLSMTADAAQCPVAAPGTGES